jgi:F0F1-type ATP synthase assembly protein I
LDLRGETVEDQVGVNSGNGMVMGFAFGLVVGPMLGSGAPAGMLRGAFLGLIAGAAAAQRKALP